MARRNKKNKKKTKDLKVKNKNTKKNKEKKNKERCSEDEGEASYKKINMKEENRDTMKTETLVQTEINDILTNDTDNTAQYNMSKDEIMETENIEGNDSKQINKTENNNSKSKTRRRVESLVHDALRKSNNAEPAGK